MSIDALTLPLANLVNVRGGYPFRSAIPESRRGVVRVVQMKDVDPAGGIDWTHLIPTDLIGRRTPDWLESGDILFVTRGNRLFATCLDAPPLPTICSPHFFHLRAKSTARVLPQFLAWQINQPPLQRKLQAAAEGSSQLSIRRPELEALPISLPSLDDQKRIVRLAHSASRERSLLQALIRNREQHLEAIAVLLSQADGTTEQQAQKSP